MVYSWSREVPD